MNRILKFIISAVVIALSNTLLQAGTSDVLHAAKTVEIYHLPRGSTSMVALSPSALRDNSAWRFVFEINQLAFFEKDWVELVLMDEAHTPSDFDCRWSILFKDETGRVITELNLDALKGRGEFNGKSCIATKELWEKLHLLAKAVDPDDGLPKRK